MHLGAEWMLLWLIGFTHVEGMLARAAIDALAYGGRVDSVSYIEHNVSEVTFYSRPLKRLMVMRPRLILITPYFNIFIVSEQLAVNEIPTNKQENNKTKCKRGRVIVHKSQS